MGSPKLLEADKVEVTILLDNYTDLLMIQSTEVAKRPLIRPAEGCDPEAFVAEHGLSCLVKVWRGEEQHAVLLDAGIYSDNVLHNAALLGVDFGQIEAVVLSHGHFDHARGLIGVLSKLNRGTPLVLHPKAFLPRRLNIPGVGAAEGPPLDEAALQAAGASIVKEAGPSTLAGGLVLVLGEVERTTDFEKGFPWAEANIDGEWVADPFYDDQGVAVLVRDKGLVVVGGCSHAGIVNTVRYAQKVAGTEKVHAVLGGFHLTGPLFESIIPPTIEELRKIGPAYVVPMHCTGWKAINEFAKSMPDQFILNTVGTMYVFQ